MITFANAKINIGLHIVGRRDDGFHDLETVFYPVPLRDALEVIVPGHPAGDIRLIQSGITIEGEVEQNLVVKAYRLLRRDFDLLPVEVYLQKHIPSGAGLGGGSSDAAYMLKLLNDMFGLSLSPEMLEEYASALGADCPFFIRNQPVYAEGTGNLFSPISLSLKGYRLVIIKPDVFVSTREAFGGVIPRKPAYSLKDAIEKPVEEWRLLLKNDFEESVFLKFPVIGEIKKRLYGQGALYAAMTGSGASVYGIFKPNTQYHEEHPNPVCNCFIYSCCL